MNSDLINCDEPEDLRVISVHSSDMLYAPSDTLIIINESIPNDNNSIPIDDVRACVQTRSRTRNNDILNSGVRTRSGRRKSKRTIHPGKYEKYSLKHY